jgi:hypothetical protein
MARYEVVCARKQHEHRHIVMVGTRNDVTRTKTWTVREVRSAIDGGDSFHTTDAKDRQADVEKFDCPGCGVATLRTKADAVTDNNLEALLH